MALRQIFFLIFCLKLASSGTIDRERQMHPELTSSLPYFSENLHINEFESNYWENIGKNVVKQNLEKTTNSKVAKNIILFLGDGMNVETITASRAYLGDTADALFFETFPHIGMAKTYCVDKQVADSACTSTSYLCGVKANYATIGLNAKVKARDCIESTKPEYHPSSIAKWAMDAGKAAGLVTTTRVTHASPTGVYGHIADRDWENDAKLKEYCGPNIHNVSDIAMQLIRGEVGSNLRVIMGCGRREFLPESFIDEEGDKGKRTDDLNLIKEWQTKKETNGKYVWNREDLLKIKGDDTQFLLGLFENDHCLYNLEAIENGKQHMEPTLTEMIEKAIEVLKTEENGYFLFVEGGRIDHAHHDNYAKLALDETIQFAKAIKKATELVNMEETLIVVTADHSHAFSYAGYPGRDANILGFVGNKANDKLDHMILSYGNGLGYWDHVNQTDGTRVDPSNMPRPIKFRYPGTFPNNLETHGGGDVAVFANGPWSHLFGGNYEQNAIPHMMAYAACIGTEPFKCPT